MSFPVDPPSRGSLPPSHVGRTPFAALRHVLPLVAVLALAAIVLALGGGRFPGGRWLAVHLFTLGPLTVAVVSFSGQLGAGFTQASPEPPRLALVLAGSGTLWIAVPASLRGTVTGVEGTGVGVGATLVTAGVMVGYVRLRRLRKANPDARWGFVVRLYERAHGAFAHGALLGALVGTGVLKGAWWISAQRAHLHVMVAGFAGVTLLATLVVFGPALLRSRLADGAEARARRLIPIAVTGVTIASAGLLLSALGGAAGTAARLVGAAGMAAFAVAATSVGIDVLRSAGRRGDGVRRRVLADHVIAATSTLMVAVWADVAVVALGKWTWLDAVGGLALIGVLAQIVLAVLAFAASQVRGRTIGERRRFSDRLDVLHPWSAVAAATGTTLVVASQVPLDQQAGWHDSLGRLGVSLLLGTAAAIIGLVLGPRREADQVS